MRQPIQSLIFALLLAAASGIAVAQSARVESAWARPTPPGASVGGAFMTLVGGKSADRLLAAKSPVATVVELHAHRMEKGVASMRRIPAIDVPANGRVRLKPGDQHLMLIGLKAPLKAGNVLPLTLLFEKAGEVAVRVTVAEALDAPAARDAHAPHQH